MPPIFICQLSFHSICSFSTDAVTYGHIANSFPYKNTVDLVELKGKDIVQVFEQVASMYDEKKPSPSFLQVSGILYSLFKAGFHKIATNH